jgi:metallo-beta-lactamase family protein
MTTIASPQESKELVASRSTAIVIAASGMATGGRVLHHLEAVLPDAKNTVLFVGYQAAGTRGRSLVDGSRTLRLKGRDIAVAARVELLDSMSAHADATEIMKWLGGFTRPPQTTYIVHGEPTALDALGARIRTERHWAVHIPRHGERVEL